MMRRFVPPWFFEHGGATRQGAGSFKQVIQALVSPVALYRLPMLFALVLSFPYSASNCSNSVQRQGYCFCSRGSYLADTLEQIHKPNASHLLAEVIFDLLCNSANNRCQAAASGISKQRIRHF